MATHSITDATPETIGHIFMCYSRFVLIDPEGKEIQSHLIQHGLNPLSVQDRSGK